MPPATIIHQLCPVCHVDWVTIAYRENADNQPSRCTECDNWINATKDTKTQQVVFVGQTQPNTLDSSITKCPHCPNPLRAWRAANGALAIVHGANQVAVSTFMCEQCGRDMGLK